MKTLRNFGLALVASGGAWLLWRVNGVIGEQALMMTFGALVALAILACLAVIAGVLWLTLRPEAPQQAPTALPPVIVLLGDGRRSESLPYQAPQGLFAQPAGRAIGEREEWVQS